MILNHIRNSKFVQCVRFSSSTWRHSPVLVIVPLPSVLTLTSLAVAFIDKQLPPSVLFLFPRPAASPSRASHFFIPERKWPWKWSRNEALTVGCWQDGWVDEISVTWPAVWGHLKRTGGTSERFKWSNWRAKPGIHVSRFHYQARTLYLHGCWLYRQVPVKSNRREPASPFTSSFFVSFTLNPFSQKPTFCLLRSRSSALLCSRYTAETLSKQLPVLHTRAHTKAGCLLVCYISFVFPLTLSLRLWNKARTQRATTTSWLTW